MDSVDGVGLAGPGVVAQAAVAHGDGEVVVFGVVGIVVEGELGAVEAERGAEEAGDGEAVGAGQARHIGLGGEGLPIGRGLDGEGIVGLAGIGEEIVAAADAVGGEGGAVHRQPELCAAHGLGIDGVEEEVGVAEIDEGPFAGRGHSVEHQMAVVGRGGDVEHLFASRKQEGCGEQCDRGYGGVFHGKEAGGVRNRGCRPPRG